MCSGKKICARVAEPQRPLFRACRDLILRKCTSDRPGGSSHLRKGAFRRTRTAGDAEALDVAQGVVRDELRNQEWLRIMAQPSGRSFEEMRVAILEFLDTDVFDRPSRIAHRFSIPSWTRGIST